jgi:predicted MFS family arabinose efflux permease
VERRSASPMLQLSFFRNPTFSAANTVAAMVSFGMFGMLFFLSLYMQDVKGYSALGAGVRFLASTGAIIFTAPIAGRLAGRIGSRWPMTVGLTLVGTGMLLLMRLQPDTSYSSFWWVLTMMGVGMGLTMAPMTAAVMSSVPPARSGMAGATTNTSREVGGVFGIALLGAILTGRMKTHLIGLLTAARVPAGTRDQIVYALVHGRTGGAGALPPGVDPTLVRDAFTSSFVYGMHVAMFVAAVALLFGALVAFLFVRPISGLQPEPEPQPAAAGEVVPAQA